MGKDEAFILKSLQDFKSGKRRNYVMYGLLGSMQESQLEELAKEISTFQAKLDATKK
jgi:cytochrome c553